MIKKLVTKRNIRYLFLFDVVLMIVAIVVLLATPDPGHVQALSVADGTYDTAHLTWKPSETADGYRVYRSTDDRKYEYVGSTPDSTFKDKGLRTGTKYYYRVVARNGITVNGIDTEKTISFTPELSQPKLSIDTSKGDMQLSISAIEGAEGYEIIRDGEAIGTVKETTFVDENAEMDKTHNYKVRAVRYRKKSAYSDPSNSVKAELHAIPSPAIDATENSIMLEWGQSDYYTNYKIYNGDELLEETTGMDFVINDYELSKVYDLKLVGYTEDGKTQSPTLERKIKVEKEPMDNEGARQAACDWGEMIAADDSFAYGTGDTAHRCGCYFCGTNRSRKGSGYEKTYCCNPFVHACYAHGAGDPQMLSTCQRGGSVGMNSGDYTRYGNWENIGKPSYSSLEKGDVFIYEGHVMLFIGDDLIVHAAAEGWGANSIRTDDARVWYDNDIRFVMRYTGTGSGTMYKVKYLDKNGNAIKEPNEKNDEEGEEA